jgi:hypothetical protein
MSVLLLGTRYKLTRGSVIPNAFLCPCGEVAAIDQNVIYFHSRSAHKSISPELSARIVFNSATVSRSLLQCLDLILMTCLFAISQLMEN